VLAAVALAALLMPLGVPLPELAAELHPAVMPSTAAAASSMTGIPARIIYLFLSHLRE
jgi:hypothetical protein